MILNHFTESKKQTKNQRNFYRSTSLWWNRSTVRKQCTVHIRVFFYICMWYVYFCFHLWHLLTRVKNPILLCLGLQRPLHVYKHTCILIFFFLCSALIVSVTKLLLQYLPASRKIIVHLHLSPNLNLDLLYLCLLSVELCPVSHEVLEIWAEWNMLNYSLLGREQRRWCVCSTS